MVVSLNSGLESHKEKEEESARFRATVDGLAPRAQEVREIGILSLNNQRQHRTVHTQKNVLPYTLC